MSVVNESMNGIRIIKLFAWEPNFLAKMVDSRAVEMVLLRTYMFTLGWVRSCCGRCFLHFFPRFLFYERSLASAVDVKSTYCPFVVVGFVFVVVVPSLLALVFVFLFFLFLFSCLCILLSVFLFSWLLVSFFYWCFLYMGFLAFLAFLSVILVLFLFSLILFFSVVSAVVSYPVRSAFRLPILFLFYALDMDYFWRVSDLWPHNLYQCISSSANTDSHTNHGRRCFL